MDNYRFAVVCGRFQPIHNGHIDVIHKALRYASTVGLYLGSSNNCRTPQNPLTFEERLNLLKFVFPEEIHDGRLIIKPLNDREHPCDDVSWGKYYLDCIHKDFRSHPDLFVYGNDKVRGQWFVPEDLRGIDELTVNRDTINISGTRMRELILQGNKQAYCEFTPQALWDKFEFVKKILEEVQNCEIK